MKICGIVCEYNPFHRGHSHQIEESRRRGVDGIVCVMSGNFVQRAEPALLRKHARAESAVLCGADLVLELPIPWALSSAETFADGAVHLLSALSALTHISFGCETDDLDLLERIAKLLDTPAFSERLKLELALGDSFAAARARAIDALCPGAGALLELPNNILAVEYLKANLRRGRPLTPLAIRRTVAHDGETASGAFASALSIRKRVFTDGAASAKPYLTDASFSILQREIDAGRAPVVPAGLDVAVLAGLKKLSSEDFLRYADVSEGLHIRLKDAVDRAVSFEDAVALAKTKRYAHARIRRILLNAFLEIPAEFTREPPPYLRVLALNARGKSILAAVKKQCNLPILTKPADVRRLSPRAQSVFAREAVATELYNLAAPVPGPGMQEWTTSPVCLDK